jgi:hypothetical protein
MSVKEIKELLGFPDEIGVAVLSNSKSPLASMNCPLIHLAVLF